MTFTLDRSALVFASILALVACRGPDDPGTTDSASTSASSTTDDSASSTGGQIPTTTGDDTTGTVDPSTSSSTAPDDTGTTDPCGQGFIGMCTTTDPSGGDPQPNGSPCESDAECESMHCFTSPLGMGQGVCSECSTDMDCMDAGTGLSCSADLVSMQAVCKPGDPGDQCMSEAACMDDLFCEPVIDGLEGFLPNTCSECASSADCMMGDICSPVLDTMTISGQKQCVAPGSVPNDGLCPEDDVEGDAACESGHCSTVDVMGFIQVPVCGECETDNDCMMGETCMPGVFDLNAMGFTGATCG
jgi:hypothetical protein